MKEWFEAMLSRHQVANLLVMLLVVIGLVAARRVALRIMEHNAHLPVAVMRRWRVTSRNVVLLLALLSAMMIWGAELRTLALSLVAVAAAIVIAFKEAIMCLVGGLVRSSGRLFNVGDRIEVEKIRGDVIDLGLMTTTVLEVGPNDLTHQLTGRAVVVPNALFLTHPVINETFTDAFVLHTFTVPVALDEDWARHESALLEAAKEVCAPFMADASTHFTRVAREVGIDTPSVEPRVILRPTASDVLSMVVRLPLPARTKGRLEQHVLRAYLQTING